jgi:hypothetical protein
MGNCLRSRRRHELLLHSCDGDDVTLGQGEPLVRQKLVWTADMPLTMGQLQGRRDTFWDTAPMYDGRREIWDALRAAVEAAEREEYDLAQAILSGANITLPTGHLSEAYDELGNRYVIPRYCLSQPTNLQESVGDTDDNHSSVTQSSPLLRQRVVRPAEGGEVVAKPPPSFIVKVRLTTLSKDIRVAVFTTDRIRDLKRKLHELHGVEPQKTTMLYSGRVLTNNTLIKHINVPRGHVIQAVVT